MRCKSLQSAIGSERQRKYGNKSHFLTLTQAALEIQSKVQLTRTTNSMPVLISNKRNQIDRKNGIPPFGQRYTANALAFQGRNEI